MEYLIVFGVFSMVAAYAMIVERCLHNS